MPKEYTLEETYDKCITEANLIPQDKVDIRKIKSMVLIALDDMESAKSLILSKSPKYSSVFKLYYDSLHQLVEALLLFDKVKSYNHLCLFSYLCVKHPELELS